MAGSIDTAPVRGGAGWAWTLIAITVAGSVIVLGASSPDGQMFIALSAVIAALAAILIPHAVRREPTVSARFLSFALAAHIVGSLARFLIIQTVYHGIADANGYYSAGTALYQQFRSFAIPPFPQPGTQFMNWATGLIFAFTGPTLLGGFVVIAALGFVGSWYFYKAFRLGFPDGDHRSFKYLIFLLPSMWYWPSSLGKDGLIVLFLGIASYGFALILRSRLPRGILMAVLGLGGIVMIRPPMAAALAVAAAAAFLVRPARVRSIQVQALMWLVVVPFLGVLVYFTIQSSRTYIQNDDPVAAFEAQQAKDFSATGSGSNYAAANPFTPKGLPIALVTVNFRPFPTEAGGTLSALASLEGVVILLVCLRRWPRVWAGLKSWRRNGMVIFAVLSWFSLSVILSSLPNFGLLARQRPQVLPYLFMLLCMVPKASRGKRSASPARAPATVQA